MEREPAPGTKEIAFKTKSLFENCQEALVEDSNELYDVILKWEKEGEKGLNTKEKKVLKALLKLTNRLQDERRDDYVSVYNLLTDPKLQQFVLDLEIIDNPKINKLAESVLKKTTHRVSSTLKNQEAALKHLENQETNPEFSNFDYISMFSGCEDGGLDSKMLMLEHHLKINENNKEQMKIFTDSLYHRLLPNVPKVKSINSFHEGIRNLFEIPTLDKKVWEWTMDKDVVIFEIIEMIEYTTEKLKTDLQEPDQKIEKVMDNYKALSAALAGKNLKNIHALQEFIDLEITEIGDLIMMNIEKLEDASGEKVEPKDDYAQKMSIGFRILKMSHLPNKGVEKAMKGFIDAFFQSMKDLDDQERVILMKNFEKEGPLSYNEKLSNYYHQKKSLLRLKMDSSGENDFQY